MKAPVQGCLNGLRPQLRAGGGTNFLKMMNADERDEGTMAVRVVRMKPFRGTARGALPVPAGSNGSQDEVNAPHRRTPRPHGHRAFIPFIRVHHLQKNAPLRPRETASVPPFQRGSPREPVTTRHDNSNRPVAKRRAPPKVDPSWTRPRMPGTVRPRDKTQGTRPRETRKEGSAA